MAKREEYRVGQVRSPKLPRQTSSRTLCLPVEAGELLTRASTVGSMKRNQRVGFRSSQQCLPIYFLDGQ